MEISWLCLSRRRGGGDGGIFDDKEELCCVKGLSSFAVNKLQTHSSAIYWTTTSFSNESHCPLVDSPNFCRLIALWTFTFLRQISLFFVLVPFGGINHRCQLSFPFSPLLFSSTCPVDGNWPINPTQLTWNKLCFIKEKFPPPAPQNNRRFPILNLSLGMKKKKKMRVEKTCFRLPISSPDGESQTAKNLLIKRRRTENWNGAFLFVSPSPLAHPRR